MNVSQIDTSFISRELAAIDEDEALTAAASQSSHTILNPDISFQPTVEAPVAKSKSRGPNRLYQFCTSYKTLEEAEKILKNEKIWSKLDFKASKQLNGISKYTYRCNQAKYREERCRSQVRIHLHPDSLEVSIHRTYCPHTHLKDKSSVSQEARDEIVNVINSGYGYTPKNFIEHLENKKIEPPVLKDLYNFLARFKKQKFGTSKLTLGELSSWCEDNSKVPSEIMQDEPFVVDYSTFFPEHIEENPKDYDDGDNEKYNNNNNKIDMQFFFFFLTDMQLINFFF